MALSVYLLAVVAPHLVAPSAPASKPIAHLGDSSSTLSVLPTKDDPSYRCLCFVDLYTDTVFNYLQADDLVAELERLRLRLAGEPQAAAHGAFIDDLQ